MGVGVGGMLHKQQHVLHITLPRLTSKPLAHLHLLPHLEMTNSFAIRVDTTRGTTDTGYKPSIGVERGAKGLLPTVEEILGSQRTAVTHLKLDSSQPVGTVPPPSAILIGCMGIRDYPKSRLKLLHQSTKKIIKRDQF